MWQKTPMYKESFVMKVLEMRFCWKELEQTHLFTPPKYGMHSKQILQKLKQQSLIFRSAEINFWLLPGHNVYIITIRGHLKLKWFLPLKSVIFEHYFCSYKMFVWSLNSDKQTFTPLSPFCHLTRLCLEMKEIIFWEVPPATTVELEK